MRRRIRRWLVAHYRYGWARFWPEWRLRLIYGVWLLSLSRTERAGWMIWYGWSDEERQRWLTAHMDGEREGEVSAG